jgi:signal transduction histidine kinase
MHDQVRHLERAARTAVVTSMIEVAPVVKQLARTMEKIHRERNIAIRLQLNENVRFRGEQQDLEEMLGNLVDNACKWANARVDIEMFALSGPRLAEPSYFRLQVDDDGPGHGLPSARRC